jgi:hypothetical protein
MKTLALAVTVFLLAGCATPYQSGGFRGGYKEIQLDENVFQVSFRGNAFVSASRVENYTLLRSAEVAMENGYDYFVIVDKDAYETNGTVYTPATTYTSGSMSGNNFYGTTTTYGGMMSSYSKPSSSNMIACYHEKPEGFSFRSENVISSLRDSLGVR